MEITLCLHAEPCSPRSQCPQLDHYMARAHKVTQFSRCPRRRVRNSGLLERGKRSVTLFTRGRRCINESTKNALGAPHPQSVLASVHPSSAYTRPSKAIYKLYAQVLSQPTTICPWLSHARPAALRVCSLLHFRRPTMLNVPRPLLRPVSASLLLLAGRSTNVSRPPSGHWGRSMMHFRRLHSEPVTARLPCSPIGFRRPCAAASSIQVQHDGTRTHAAFANFRARPAARSLCRQKPKRRIAPSALNPTSHPVLRSLAHPRSLSPPVPRDN
ncbi:hypothetical protein C8Q79DRAFT_633890 [Trametes meyenii]|nr:hypothetical protein C8Q79DRAFT_633890 [Trametes meyenii]